MTNLDRVRQMINDLHFVQKDCLSKINTDTPSCHITRHAGLWLVYLSGGRTGRATRYSFSLKGKFLNSTIVTIPGATAL